MPIYEYRCSDCGGTTELLVRAGRAAAPACSTCGGETMERLPVRFAYHRTLKTRLEQLDPKYDKMIDASNPDLSFDSLRKRYGLDRPATSGDGA